MKDICAVLENLPPHTLKETLYHCCSSHRWVDAMAKRFPFATDEDLFEAMEQAAGQLAESDWLEAFAEHPEIGNVSDLQQKFSATAPFASEEQSQVRYADLSTLNQLAALNREYKNKFGFIFIICATEKSASEMLKALKARLPNPRSQELETAAQEQLKITRLRLKKLAQS